MLLQHLCAAPHVTIYYDAYYDWLYIEWEGYLTLSVVQYACVEVAHCYLEHAYPRVLNSNALVTGADPGVAGWLATNFLPNLSLAGVERLAWVHSAELRGHSMAQLAVDRTQDEHVALFSDLDEAIAWLQPARPLSTTDSAAAPSQAQPPAGGKLPRVVEAFTQHIKHQLAGEELLPVAPAAQPAAAPRGLAR